MKRSLRENIVLSKIVIRSLEECYARIFGMHFWVYVGELCGNMEGYITTMTC